MIRMPLKLKLGRSSGRYELSEDIYILTIFLGEAPMAQCTLTSQSTSENVFRYLAEKFHLNQCELFGLQYQMKATDTEKRMLRWIEPDKPIRRQLERWACRREKKWAVNLAILHACSNVFTLHDFYSRFVYYTLLKCEVLQGEKFSLDLDKCVNLAAYQLQIECPDCKPTLQQLRIHNLLPQSMLRNPEINTDETYMRILTAFEKLHTMEPAYATLLYIVDVQQCEGYGEEMFTCKDGSSLEEVSLGYSLDWIFLRRTTGNSQKFRWEEVREIVAHKRKVLIKYREGQLANLAFSFEDNEMARYVATVLGWKLHHARTDAQQQRSARLSVNLHNLQGGVVPMPFSQPGSFLRRSNTNMNAIRLSVELNAGNGFGPCQFVPSTPQLGGRTSEQQQSSQQSTVHSVQSCAAVRTSSVNSSSSAALSVCCRSISVSQMPPNVAAAFLRPPGSVEKTSPPSAAFYPPGMSSAASAVPAPPSQLQQQASNSSQDSDWLRNEQREVLKRMLTEKRRLNKIGSSPEINTLGKSGGVAGTGAAKCKRHHPGPAGGGGGFSLARKIFTSTPNLHTTRQQRPGKQQTPPPALPMPIQQNGAHNNGHISNGGLLPLPSPLAAHRLLPHPALANAIQQQPFPSPYCSPPPPMPMAAALSGGGTVGFFLAPQQNGCCGTPSTPKTTNGAFFSQGQVIDENGQQRTIVYPMPPEAPGPSVGHPLAQQSPSPPHQQLIFPSNSPPLDMDSRSSPKSSSLHSSEPMPSAGHCPLQPVSSLAPMTGEPKTLPEFEEIEFTGIPAKSLSADFSVAIRPHNLPRNRGSKIYPYNENRVKLQGTKANPDGYINASELNVPVRGTQLRYIISQAPIQKTIEDFWQMVWETEARLIVMLVNPHQINKDATIPSYIPSQAKEKLTVGDFFLRLKNVTPPQMQQKFQSTTTFTLSRQGNGGQRRTIYHLYCADFSEQGVPSSEENLIRLIDAVASVKRHIQNEAKGGVGGGSGAKEAKKEPTTATTTTVSVPTVSKSNSSKESNHSNSGDISRRERAETMENGGGGWTKKLRFEQQNGHQESKQSQQLQNGGSRGSSAGEQSVLKKQEESLAIVQCTDGASESGLYLMAELIIRCIEKNADLDIAQLLRELRHQRMGLVKNAKQYKFINDLVAYYQGKNRLI